MTTEDVLRRVLAALSNAGIPYMMTGSFASSYHGFPRATQDIDLVIAPSAKQLELLIGSLPSDEYYVDLDAAHAALKSESMFNIVDHATGWKIDLIIRKSRPFSQEEFNRRVDIEAFGMQLCIASAEDVLISKLEWAKLGQSARQIEDVGELLRIRWESLDQAYLMKWVDELKLIAEWMEAIKRAGVSD